MEAFWMEGSEMSELVESCRIAEIIPYSIRQIVEMARKGELPGAVKTAKGRKWMFDEQRIRRWLKQLEAEQCRRKGKKTSINVVDIGGSKLSLMEEKSMNPLVKRLWSKPENTETKLERN